VSGSEECQTVHVPARDIPVPTSVSPEAQAILAMGGGFVGPFPALDDLEGWRAYVAAGEAQVRAGLEWVAASTADVAIEEEQIGGVPVYVASPPDLASDDRRVYLEIHGGALIIGGGDNCRGMAAVNAKRWGVRMWAIDHRMPPDHPFPAALDDCVAVFRALLTEHRADDIVVGGSSAGANLAAALVLRARDEGLPMPAGVVLLTPEIDLTESGDSFQTLLGVDSVLSESLMPANLLYSGGHDLSDPYLSPLFGDFTKGFPPTFLCAGTRDLFLSNAVRMHRALRAAGVAAELHVMEAAPHGGFHGVAPEDREIDAELCRFLDERFGDRPL
jgi:monoterpene epsilon-lactone hydrolase